MIPYAVHETAIAIYEKAYKRLWILAIIIFLSLVCSNAGWIWHESKREERAMIVPKEDQGADFLNGL